MRLWIAQTLTSPHILHSSLQADFLHALGLKKQDYEEARQQESFGTSGSFTEETDVSNGANSDDLENLEFLPWSNRKFSFNESIESNTTHNMPM